MTQNLKDMKLSRAKISSRGFTFIELLVAMAVVAISFLPLMNMFSASLEQVYLSGDMNTARYIAQVEMEKFKNLALTEKEIIDIGNIWYPRMDLPPLEINDKKWRVFRKVKKGEGPLEVRIKVYVSSGDDTEILDQRPMVDLAILVQDLDWGSIE